MPSSRPATSSRTLRTSQGGALATSVGLEESHMTDFSDVAPLFVRVLNMLQDSMTEADRLLGGIVGADATGE